MKTKIVCFVYLLSFHFIYPVYGQKNSPAKMDKKIVIRYVERDTYTIFSVSCSYFETYFGKEDFMKKVVKDKKEIEDFLRILKATGDGSEMLFFCGGLANIGLLFWIFEGWVGLLPILCLNLPSNRGLDRL